MIPLKIDDSGTGNHCVTRKSIDAHSGVAHTWLSKDGEVHTASTKAGRAVNQRNQEEYNGVDEDQAVVMIQFDFECKWKRITICFRNSQQAMKMMEAILTIAASNS